jgi:hypothetical protein
MTNEKAEFMTFTSLQLLETYELKAILDDALLKVTQAGNMVETAKEIYHNAATQQEAARADFYLKNCRKYLKDCRKFRTLIQSILIDRLTAEQTESPYPKKEKQPNEKI